MRYFTDQNGPKGWPYENEFWPFWNIKMNVTNSYSRKSWWKTGVICLVSMISSCFMVLKLSKKVHFLQFCADFRQKPKSVKAIYIYGSEVLITVYQKMIWFVGVWLAVHEILAIKISKTMLTQQKFNKILRFQTFNIFKSA